MPVRVLIFLLLAACAASPTAPSVPPKPADPPVRTDGPAGAPAPAPPADETLARCLKRKGVHLYGAHWCKPCHDQLDLFGASAKDVPYTDCQPEGTFGNIPECDALGIDSYPTWIFPDGYRALGTRSLKWLAASTDCPLK